MPKDALDPNIPVLLQKLWKSQKTGVEKKLKELKKSGDKAAVMPSFKENLQKNLAIWENLATQARELRKTAWGIQYDDEKRNEVMKKRDDVLYQLVQHSHYIVSKIALRYTTAVEDQQKKDKGEKKAASKALEPLTKVLGEIAKSARSTWEACQQDRVEMDRLRKNNQNFEKAGR